LVGCILSSSLTGFEAWKWCLHPEGLWGDLGATHQLLASFQGGVASFLGTSLLPGLYMLSPCLRCMRQQRLGGCYRAGQVFLGYCLCRKLVGPQPVRVFFWHKQPHTQAGSIVFCVMEYLTTLLQKGCSSVLQGVLLLYT